MNICWVNERDSCLIHLCMSPSNASVSHLGGGESLKVSQVTRPPPCPQGGCVQNHLTLCFVLFFPFCLESPKNLHSERLVGTNPRSLLCATEILLESVNPFRTFHRGQKGEKRKKGPLRAHPTSTQIILTSLQEMEQMHLFSRE